MNFDMNTGAFLELLRAGLWDKDVELRKYETADFSEIMCLSQEQTVVGLVAAGIEHVKGVEVPLDMKLQFAGAALQIERRNKEMNTFIAEMIAKLRKKNIYTLLVKGQGIAQCYEKPLWRACGDVDLFLSDENYHKAKELLLPLGEISEPEEKAKKHFAMNINGWEVELHGSLRSGLSLRIDHALGEVKNDVLCGGKVRSWNNGNTQVFLPSADNDAIYVFTHILQHFYKGGIGLRQICDWCRLLFCYRDKLDLQLLESRVRKMGLMTEWQAFGTFAVEYLGMPVEAMPFLEVRSHKEDGRCVIDKRLRRKAERIMDFIMMSGNMGHNRGSWLMEHDSWFTRLYVVRKAFSMRRRIGDLISHARIFPLDSLRFFPYMMLNGVRSAVRGE